MKRFIFIVIVIFIMMIAGVVQAEEISVTVITSGNYKMSAHVSKVDSDEAGEITHDETEGVDGWMFEVDRGYSLYITITMTSKESNSGKIYIKGENQSTLLTMKDYIILVHNVK